MLTVIYKSSHTGAAEAKASRESHSYVRFTTTIRYAAFSGTVGGVISGVKTHHDFTDAQTVPLSLCGRLDLQI